MLLLKNATFYTMKQNMARAEAILIDRGIVIATGDYEELIALAPASTRQQDLGKRWVLPGLTDAHIHLQKYALSLQKEDCETSTRQECLQRVSVRANSTPKGDWILGHGWNQNSWENGFGDAVELDAAAPDNPVYLTAKSLHAGWANTKALRLANITLNTPDPPGGRIGRQVDGQPNGILFESAMQLIENVLPEPGLAQIETAIQSALPHLWALGLTGVHDFDRRACFAALQNLHTRGELKLRVLKSIPSEDLHHAIGLGLRTGFGDDYLRIGSVKFFADGALGPHTAAMIDPYEGDSVNRGMLLLDGEELFEHGRKAVDNGLSLAVHAIGDRANHEVLNAITQLRDYESQRNLKAGRHRIEHVQVIHPQDTGRLAELGIVASMQPIHAISDMHMADRYWGKRAELSYAWRTQLNNGARLAFGSDAPVESPNPFWGIHAAITRKKPSGSEGAAGWYPEQTLNRSQAFEAYTRGPAYTSGLEEKQGRLMPGACADLIVLDRDPFSCLFEELYDMLPVATMVAGEWVHRG